MSNVYNLDGIKTELKKSIAEARALATAWGSVTFPVKKDGKPFANLSKNISGATVKRNEYSLQSGDNNLWVYAQTPETGYINDYVNLYEVVRYMKDDAKKAKTQNYAPKQQFLEQLYIYDLDDIKQAVSKRAEYWRTRRVELTEQLKLADEVYNAHKAAYHAAMKKLELMTSDYQNNDLFYLVRDTVKDRYPYG